MLVLVLVLQEELSMDVLAPGLEPPLVLVVLVLVLSLVAFSPSEQVTR